MNIINRQHKQNGATLLFALVLLLLMTVLGLSSIRGVSLQERMASNLNERDLAFQAAEAALLAAEKEILLNPEPFGMVDCTSTSILNCATIPSNTFTASNVDWMNVPDDYAINTSKELGTAQFHIQLIGRGSTGIAFGQLNSANNIQYGVNPGVFAVQHYRITARSRYPGEITDRALVVLQTTLRRAI